MDVNGTRFHLLATARDWRPYAAGADETSPLLSCDGEAGEPDAAAERPAVVWDADRQSLSLRPLLFRFPSGSGAAALRTGQRRGAARSGFGHWLTISDDATGLDLLAAGEREAWTYWRPGLTQIEGDRAEAGDFEPEARPPEIAPGALRGMAITRHQHLVVGTLDPGGLMVFDLYAGGAPTVLPWPDEIGFRPLDLAARPGGGVWVLDRPEAGPARLWALDRHLRVVGFGPADPARQPADGGAFAAEDGTERPASTPYPSPIRATDALVLSGSAVAIEPLPDGTLLVLEADAVSRVRRLTDRGVQRGPAVTVSTCVERWVARDTDAPFAFSAHDLAFVPDEGLRPPVVTGTLTVVGAGGDQAFALRLLADDDELTLALRPSFLPLRRFGGKGIVAAGGAVHYDLGERWLPLAAQPRPRFEAAGTLTLDAPPLDGRVPGCVWHRLFVDACIPVGTEIAVESRAADDPALFPSVPWQPEPRLHLRATGTEVPYYEPVQNGAERTGTWELLFQRAQGRYLQLRLGFAGDGRQSPRAFALRAYYGRFSYLDQYLPAVYRRDGPSASFLDRFLANAEGTLTEIEGLIAQAQTLFDVRTVRDDFLPWLAAWFGTTLDPAYDEHRRRLFLAHAVQLFRERGTPRGIARLVRLAVDPCPTEALFAPDAVDCDVGRISPRCAGARVVRSGLRVQEGYREQADPRAHHLTVLVPIDPGMEPVAQEQRLALVRRVVEAARPAHVTLDVGPFWALLRVGEARLGVDTVLDVGPRYGVPRLGQGALAAGALGAEPPFDLAGRVVVGRDGPGPATVPC